MKIAYSELSDKVYAVSIGGKEDITQNFVQVFLLWMHSTNTIIEPGKTLTRSLQPQGETEPEWTITVTRNHIP